MAVRSGYKASWSTQNNRMGRLFPGGVNTGGWASRNYLLTTPASDPQPVVYVAVVDSVGNWVYRVPADRANTIWPGIHRKTIAQTLQAAPSERPTQVNPCLGDYCLVFTSNCQARTRSEAEAQSCGFRPQDGFCGNWYASATQPMQQGPVRTALTRLCGARTQVCRDGRHTPAIGAVAGLCQGRARRPNNAVVHGDGQY